MRIASLLLYLFGAAFAIFSLLQPGIGTWSVLVQALGASIDIAGIAWTVEQMRQKGGA